MAASSGCLLIKDRKPRELNPTARTSKPTPVENLLNRSKLFIVRYFETEHSERIANKLKPEIKRVNSWHCPASFVARRVELRLSGCPASQWKRDDVELVAR